MIRISPRALGFTVGLIAAMQSEAATVTVTNTRDNLAGSLRQAIQDALPDDTIAFHLPTNDPNYDAPTKTWTITLSSAELIINKNLQIDGGNNKIIIQRSGANGTPRFRIFNVSAGTVVLSHLHIRAGNLQGITNPGGAGIYNAGTLTVDKCALSGNVGGTNNGGGIHNAGTLTLISSTLSGNSVNGVGFSMVAGGGIFNASGSSAMISNCTIARNTTYYDFEGGGIFNAPSATLHIRNTVVASNTDAAGITPADVAGAVVSDGYNFIGDGSLSTGFGSSGSHDQVGTRATPADPNLSPLQDNGGTTLTMRPQSGSPLIDQGDGGGITTDQRGFRRPVDQPSIANAGDGSDIGAFELGIIQTGPTFTVTTIDEHSDGICEEQDCTLWDAANAADNNAANNSVITFAPGVIGTITVTLQPSGINLLRPMTINGPSARLLTLSGAGAGRIFNVSGEGIVISGLTIADGHLIGNGGGILNAGGLTLQNCAILNNFSSTITGVGGIGGGIYNSSMLTLSNCTIANNRASGNGGGLNNDINATATITNCSFMGNNAISGGGLLSRGMLTLRSSTFAGNSATGVGSSGRGGGVSLTNGTAELTNVLIANNTALAAADLNAAGVTLTGDYNLIRTTDNWSFTSGGTHNVTGQDPKLDPSGLNNNGGPTDTIALLAGSPTINAGNDAVAPAKDQRGLARNGVSDIGAFEFAGLLPVSLGNISTRGMVGISDEVMIGGFIINGTGNKAVLLRAIGPSLSNPPFNLANTLQDPTLSLFDGTGTMITSNDNWADASNAQSIDPSLRPSNGAESAILTSLAPGAYTAIVRGANGGIGIGLVEVFDLDATVPSKLSNISTRGLVETGDSVMIGGFIVKGPDSEKVVVRAIGPSLASPPFNLTNVLQNPTLSLFNDQGTRIQFNDDWRSDQETEIIATGLQPPNNSESALLRTLTPGNYTAIVQGVNGTTGIALVEVYGLN